MLGKNLMLVNDHLHIVCNLFIIVAFDACN